MPQLGYQGLQHTGGGPADDSTVVHKTGAELIAGIKTFSSPPVIPSPATASNPVRNDDPRFLDPIDATVQTTDATAGVVIGTLTPPVGVVISVDVQILARKVGGVDGAAWHGAATFIVTAGGVVTLFSSIVSAFQHSAGAAGWLATIVTNGTVIQFKATGQAATTIDWHVVGGFATVP